MPINQNPNPRMKKNFTNTIEYYGVQYAYDQSGIKKYLPFGVSIVILYLLLS